MSRRASIPLKRRLTCFIICSNIQKALKTAFAMFITLPASAKVPWFRSSWRSPGKRPILRIANWRFSDRFNKESEARREAALAALPALGPKRYIDLLGEVLADAGEPIELREKAAEVLGRLNQPSAQEELVKELAAAPQRLGLAIATVLAGSKTGAEKLLEAVAVGKASPRLLQERPVE